MLAKNINYIEDQDQVSTSNRKPKEEIDLDLVEELHQIGCTKEEIYRALKVDEEALTAYLEEAGYNDFSMFLIISHKRKIARKKEELLDAQIDMFLGYKEIDGVKVSMPPLTMSQVLMSIWLGKQYLDQKEPSKFESISIINQDITNAQIDFVNDNRRTLEQLV